MISSCPLTIGGVILAVAALSAAAPAIYSVKRATLTENFLLFGSSLKSTAAANATALELVDPLGDPSFLLSMQEGYAGPTFNLSRYALPLGSCRGADVRGAEARCRPSSRLRIRTRTSRCTTRTSMPPARSSSYRETTRRACLGSRTAFSRSQATRTTGRGATARSRHRSCVLGFPLRLRLADSARRSTIRARVRPAHVCTSSRRPPRLGKTKATATNDASESMEYTYSILLNPQSLAFRPLKRRAPSSTE
jgi:hypothetical protein